MLWKKLWYRVKSVNSPTIFRDLIGLLVSARVEFPKEDILTITLNVTCLGVAPPISTVMDYSS